MLSRYAMGLSSGQKNVWLTFDDGPHPLHTKSILDTLKRRHIPATFFMIGKSMERFPDLVRRAVDEGHVIGNHSYTHARLTTLDRISIQQEIERTADVLQRYCQGGKLFRPPHGAHNRLIDEIVSECGYRTMLWNASTRDWHPRYQPERWVNFGTMLVRLQDKSVVLLHDLASTADHLDRFLDRLASFAPHWRLP